MHDLKSVEFNLAGRTLKFEVGLFAEQATGAVTAKLNDTVVLATVVMSDSVREGTDFFPLSVDYEEKFYATGKIKGSRFIKREGRPSDGAVLTSRLIDRPLRPLFPKKMRNDVQVICTALSADMEVDPDVTAMNAASAALMVSGIPFEGPVGAVRIGYIEDASGEKQLIVNPTYEQVEKGYLDLVVAGTKDAILMVEAAAKEVSEEIVLEALDLAHKHIRELCKAQEELRDKVKPKALEYIEIDVPDEVKESVKKELNLDDFDKLVGKGKIEIAMGLKELENAVMEKIAGRIEAGEITKGQVKEVVLDLLEARMRENILKKDLRIDGRKLDEIRPITCLAGLLPRTHGSAMFKRGETQALSIVTLGSPGMAQIIDTMDEDLKKSYMHHYNFPPFSVGEAKPLRGTSRREIGHGDLAERSIIPILPDKETFAYTIRVVTEILSSNGSTSMASVCGSTLSLMDAGVPIKKPVSGIAMGLITDGTGNFKVLSDIQGMEDFAGDMDFKVAGTDGGITALQMDIKVKGISLEIMGAALAQAKSGRAFILQKMLALLPEPRKELSPYAPLITNVQINPELIRALIGKGGETIQKIIADTGVEIDIEDSGLVIVTSPNQEKGQAALKRIREVTYVPTPGDVFDGKVTRIMDFGAFVELVPGKEGLVHISQLAKERVNRVEDVVKVGDPLKVKLMEIDDQGRYNLSHKVLLGGSSSDDGMRAEHRGKPEHRMRRAA